MELFQEVLIISVLRFVTEGIVATVGKDYCISKSLNFNRILDGRTDISPLALLPYFIIDGVNEMGLSVTELTLFGNPSYAKDGEGSVNICEAMIIRYLLDNCSDL